MVDVSREVAAENIADLVAAWVLMTRAFSHCCLEDYVRDLFEQTLEHAQLEERSDPLRATGVQVLVRSGDWRALIAPGYVRDIRQR